MTDEKKAWKPGDLAVLKDREYFLRLLHRADHPMYFGLDGDCLFCGKKHDYEGEGTCGRWWTAEIIIGGQLITEIICNENAIKKLQIACRKNTL